MGGPPLDENAVSIITTSLSDTSNTLKDRDSTELFRLKVRGLTAILNALNTPENGDKFDAHNLSVTGKYDAAIELGSIITGKCWEMREILNQSKSAAAQPTTGTWTDAQEQNPGTGMPGR